MEVSDSLHARAVTALWIEENNGHWRSTLVYDPTKWVYRLRDRGRRVSQLLVLWFILFGDPVGQLSNACGRSECVNPYHYRDEQDREQWSWRTSGYDTGEELVGAGVDGDDGYSYQVHFKRSALMSRSIVSAGITVKDFGCYCCGARFNNWVSRNDVVCDSCWSDEDERAKMEDR